MATAAPTNGNQAPPKPTAMMVLKDRGAAPNERINAVGSILMASKDKLLAALPGHISADRMIRLFLSEIRKTPKLLNCSPESLFAAIGQAASLGLETDGVLGQAYLIPYGDTATLVPGYRGLLDLARRRDNIIIKTRCVYRQDKFVYSEGDDDRITHIPYQGQDYDTDDAAVTHVYLIARDREGVVLCRSVWTKAQVERHKERYSKGWQFAEHGQVSKGGGKKDSPWHTNWQQMARKTLVRDTIARGEIPVSAEIQRLAAQEEIIEAEVLRRTVGDHARLEVPSESDKLSDRLDPPKSAGELADVLSQRDADGEGSAEPRGVSDHVGLDSEPDAPDVTETAQTADGAGGQQPSPFDIRPEEDQTAFYKRIMAAIRDTQSTDVLDRIGDSVLGAREADGITEQQQQGLADALFKRSQQLAAARTRGALVD